MQTGLAPADFPRATWYILDGDFPNTIKLESLDVADNYIRHSNDLGLLHPSDGSEIYKLDSNWIPQIEYPLVSITPGYYRIQSFNFPADFIRHSNYLGYKHTDDFSEVFMLSSTWYIHSPGLVGAADTISLESVDFPGYFMVWNNGFMDLIKAPDAAAASYYIH
mmetsp:Transcript_44235/g.32221  ORF Transcript_44235/g.32221 Transcript_44235/m.32221 type:complete len:164 (-) Transcript_44235:177-668(-)